jgi:CheY-like chemotaxis protein
MEKPVILWADDEIDLLKPYILFLNEKGYLTETATNGDDALDILKTKEIDLVLLDENMPGLSGLETLSKIKNISPNIPVVMITKSEEVHIMEDAIGSKISDYLIKPVNPNQILLTIKKNLDKTRLVSEKTTSGYQQDFRNIGMTLSDRLDADGWKDIYKKLVYWDLELQQSNDSSMAEILSMQKTEANSQFCKFVEQNYLSWLKPGAAAPTLSHTLFKNKIAPFVTGENPVFMLLIDNLRYDQWKLIEPVLNQYFRTDSEDLYFSILPTATQYSRNSVFAGLMPSEIEKKFPSIWLNDEDEGGKNMHEEELLAEQLKRLGKNVKFSYTKITNHAAGKRMVENISNMMQNKLNVIVYNFVDMLSHARTDMEIIRELADDEKAYRSLTLSWFENSPLLEAVKLIAEKKCDIIITTDHGTVHVKEPSKVIGDRNTNTNLRYKQGKSLDYVKKDVFEIRNPADGFLPKLHVSSAYIFAKENKFFAYPNNYNHYVGYYKNTFQHGGVSMEEMMIPIVKLSPR